MLKDAATSLAVAGGCIRLYNHALYIQRTFLYFCYIGVLVARVFGVYVCAPKTLIR